MGHGSSIQSSSGSSRKGRIAQTTLSAALTFKAGAGVRGQSSTCSTSNENATSNSVKTIQDVEEKPTKNKITKKKPHNSEKKKTTVNTNKLNSKRKISGSNTHKAKQSDTVGETKITVTGKYCDSTEQQGRSGILEEIERVLSGAVDETCPLNTKLIRIFISSTFTDTEHERNALMQNVYPKLKSFCKAHGYGFQVVDMRWGIRDEVTDIHETTELCIREIRKCQQLSAGPNFITLLSDKYGYCPIPNKIEAEEFQQILTGVDNQSDIELFSKWYKEDLNAIPPSYVLQPVSSWFPDYFASESDFLRNKAREKWNIEFEQLKKSLMNAVRKVFPDDQKFRQYARSVSEAEIKEGILNPCVDTSRCGWFRRQFTDIEVASQTDNPTILKYVDRTEKDENGVNIAQLQDSLKCELKKALNPQCISVYSFKWNENGIDPEMEEHKKYIQQYCNDFQVMLTRMITKSMEDNRNPALESPLYQEVCQHTLFCQSKIEMFYGRKDILQKMCEYIKSSIKTPLVLHGKSGCGKTSIIAKSAQLVQEWTKENSCIVLRFLGTTPRSSSIRQLLTSMLQQIKSIYNLNIKIPKGTKSLTQAFPPFLTSASKHKPLIVLLDSLDQLSPNGGGRQLSWLPRTLPDYVKMVVSTLPGAQYRCYPKLRAFFKDPKTFVEVPSLPESDVHDILTMWLKKKLRCLQPHQFSVIKEAFVHCPLPLFLKLSFDEACLWHSYLPLEHTRLQVTVRDAINSLFERTERRHGELLVRYALGYLTGARSGLTTNELEDILSTNEEVLNDVFQYWEPPVRRLPPLLWIRIVADLDSYLVSRGAEGARVTNWYHRQFSEAAKARYLSDEQQKINLHSHIASYFMGQDCDDDAINEGSSTAKVLNTRLSSVAFQPIKLSRNQYNLRKLHELPYHLIVSKQWDVLKEKVLCNYEWLEAKIRARSLGDVLDDFHQVSETHNDQDINDVNELLELGKHAIVADPGQLASQLVARLYDKQVYDAASLISCPLSNTLRKLRQDAHSSEQPSLLPNRAFLTPPGGQLIRTLVGHKSGVHGLAVSHDGNYLITGSQDGSLKVWLMKDGQMMTSVTDLGEDINTIRCCNEDKHIVASSRQGLTILEFDTGEILRSINLKFFDHPPPFTLVGLKGTQVVAFTEKCLVSFDITTGKASMKWPDIHPVGKTGQNSLLTSYNYTLLCNSEKDENSLNVIDIKQSRVTKSFVVFDNEDDESFLNLTGIAMRQENEVIVAKKMRVDLYDILEGTKTKSIRCKLDDWISHLSILPETDQLAFPKRNSFSLLNLNTEQRKDVSEKSDYISRTLLAAEDVIVTSGGDNIVRVWDLTKKDIGKNAGKSETLLQVRTLADDFRHIITVGRLGIDNHVITTWDLSTVLPVCKVRGIHSNYIEIISDRRAALRVHNEVAIIDLCTWKVLRFLKGKIPDFMYAGVPDLRVVNDRKEIVTYAFDRKSLKVYDVETGDEAGEMVSPRHENKILAFIVNKEGTVLALNDENLDIIYIWDVMNRQILFHIERAGYLRYSLNLAVFTPSGKFFVNALGRPEGCIKHPSVWNVETKALVHDLRYPNDTHIFALAIVDEQMALTSHKDTANIVIWDIIKGIACYVLPSMHYGPRIDLICYGGRYAVSNDGRTIVLWDVKEGKQLSSFTADKITTVQQLFDGNVIAVGCESPLPLVVLSRQGKDLKPYECPVEGTRAMQFTDINMTLEGINSPSNDK